MDGIHVVNKGLHSLVHAGHGLIDGMLHDARFAFKPVERLFQIVVYLLIIYVRIVFARKLLQGLDLFYETGTNVRGEIKVESGYGLSAVHLVLCRFQRDASQHTGRFDTLGRTR